MTHHVLLLLVVCSAAFSTMSTEYAVGTSGIASVGDVLWDASSFTLCGIVRNHRQSLAHFAVRLYLGQAQDKMLALYAEVTHQQGDCFLGLDFYHGLFDALKADGTIQVRYQVPPASKAKPAMGGLAAMPMPKPAPLPFLAPVKLPELDAECVQSLVQCLGNQNSMQYVYAVPVAPFLYTTLVLRFVSWIVFQVPIAP